MFQLIEASLYYILQGIKKQQKAPSLNAKTSNAMHKYPQSILLNNLGSLILLRSTKVSY